MAVNYWSKAASVGNNSSQAALAGMYAEGKGVPQDYVRAHMWFNLAASKGNEEIERGRTIFHSCVKRF